VPGKVYAVVLVSIAGLSSGCAHAKDATPPPQKPANALVKLDSLTTTGWPAQGPIGPTGTTVRFLERGRFSLGLVLRNSSSTELRLVNAWTLDPAHSLVRFVGTRFTHWRPRQCPPHVSGCLAPAFPFSSSTGRTPRALVLGPGKQAAVQLSFELGSCAERPFSSAGAQRLALAYRQADVRTVERIDLGSARLRPRPPTAGDCRVRPASHIAVTGPFASSWQHTIPRMNTDVCHRLASGTLQCADGDRCARTPAGTLFFRSGVYQSSPDKPAIYLSITVPRIAGTGAYPAARVGFVAGIGVHGWTAFAARASRVTVTSSTRTRYEGRVRAQFFWRGHRFHASGTWRCVTDTA